MTHRTKLLFLLLCCALSLIPGRAAQAEKRVENPKALQGIWSSPDCADAESLWIVSKYFFLRFGPGILSVDEAQDWAEAEEDGDRLYALRPARDNPALLSRSNDGLLRVIDAAWPEGALPKAWKAAQDGPYREYSHCAKLFGSTPSLGQSEVNAVFLLDQAVADCGTVRPEDFLSARSCQAALFTLFDGDRDGALDRAELTHLYRQLAFLNAASTACPAVKTGQDGNSAAGVFAGHLFRANGQKAVRPGDLPALRRTEKNHPVWLDFIGKAQSLHALTGFIPAAQNRDPECRKADGAFLSKDSAANPLQIQWNAPRILPGEKTGADQAN